MASLPPLGEGQHEGIQMGGALTDALTLTPEPTGRGDARVAARRLTDPRSIAQPRPATAAWAIASRRRSLTIWPVR
jgi:hypothetical protein